MLCQGAFHDPAFVRLTLIQRSGCLGRCPLCLGLGNLNRARKGVYEAVSKARHADNAAVRKEPDGSETF